MYGGDAHNKKGEKIAGEAPVLQEHGLF